MDNLTDIEKELLKILHCDFVGTTKNNNPISSSGEVFEYVGSETYFARDHHKFNGKETMITFDVNGKEYRSISIKNDRFEYDLSECIKEECPSVNLIISTREVFYDVEIKQNNYSREFLQTTITHSDDDLGYGQITCDVVSGKVKGILGPGINNDFGPLELNSYNYLKILKKLIRAVCCYNNDVVETYIKMVPVFRLAYDNLAKVSDKYITEYAKLLARERKRIIQNADDEIAKINDERNEQLQKNYEMLKKYTNYVEENRQRTR